MYVIANCSYWVPADLEFAADAANRINCFAKSPGLFAVARHSGLRSSVASDSARFTPATSKSMAYTYCRVVCRLIKPTGINTIKSDLVQQPKHYCVRCFDVASKRQSEFALSACSLPDYEMLRIDVVERLDHRTAQLLSNPLALGRAGFDPFNTAVPLLWIVVAGMDHDDVVWNSGKQIGRQFGNVLLGNRHDNHISTTCRVLLTETGIPPYLCGKNSIVSRTLCSWR